MRAPVWSDALEIGVAVVDGDHRRLIDRMNDVFVACLVGEGPAALRGHIDRMIIETRDHFAREEAEMAAIAYPGLDGHRTRHQALLLELRQIGDAQVAALSPERALALMAHLRDWLMDHIETEDRRLAAAVAAAEP